MLGRFFRRGKVRPGFFFPRGKSILVYFFRGWFYPGAVFPGGGGVLCGGKLYATTPACQKEQNAIFVYVKKFFFDNLFNMHLFNLTIYLYKSCIAFLNFLDNGVYILEEVSFWILLGECHCWWTKKSPRALVAKFYGRLRLIRSVLRASNFPYWKFLEIVILWVYYTIPFGFSLFWHFLASLIVF